MFAHKLKDCGLALTWHWVFIVLTCSGRKHYLKIE